MVTFAFEQAHWAAANKFSNVLNYVDHAFEGQITFHWEDIYGRNFP